MTRSPQEVLHWPLAFSRQSATRLWRMCDHPGVYVDRPPKLQLREWTPPVSSALRSLGLSAAAAYAILDPLRVQPKLSYYLLLHLDKDLVCSFRWQTFFREWPLTTLQSTLHFLKQDNTADPMKAYFDTVNHSLQHTGARHCALYL